MKDASLNEYLNSQDSPLLFDYSLDDFDISSQHPFVFQSVIAAQPYTTIAVMENLIYDPSQDKNHDQHPNGQDLEHSSISNISSDLHYPNNYQLSTLYADEELSSDLDQAYNCEDPAMMNLNVKPSAYNEQSLSENPTDKCINSSFTFNPLIPPDPLSEKKPQNESHPIEEVKKRAKLTTEEKYIKRLKDNRKSAQASRERKKQLMSDLRFQADNLVNELNQLNVKIKSLTKENASLRKLYSTLLPYAKCNSNIVSTDNQSDVRQRLESQLKAIDEPSKHRARRSKKKF